jgi:protein-export membrane protein SecD
MASYSRKRLSVTIVLILVLALFSVLVDWHASPLQEGGTGFNVPNSVPGASFWNKFDYRLGLDLKGGTHLIYQADTSQIGDDDRESAVEGVRDVIERRVNAFGVSEPVVQTNKSETSDYRLIVELAGISDVDQAIAMIGETPLLQFKEMNPEYNADRVLTEEQQEEIETANEDAIKLAGEVLQKALAGDDFAELAREYSEDGSAQVGGDLGWAARGIFVPEFESAIFDDLLVGEITPKLVETEFGYHIIKKIDERQMSDSNPDTGVEATDLDGSILDDIMIETNDIESNTEVLSSHILIRKKNANDIFPMDEWVNTELTGKQLKRAFVSQDSMTLDWEVSLEFNSEGGQLFEDITERNIGKPVAIYLDGEPISVPNVNEKITGGKAVITGRFNQVEAKELVQRLNAGALPVPIELISQQTVGPTLGAISVQKSIVAGLYGLLAIAIFMLLVYRLPGLFAVIALAIYTAVVLMIFKVVPVFTLTLAGVAGFILSIGIAVDANVLIFERLKEELRAGRHVAQAVEEGFKRAWTSIWASNFSTLLICFILYWFGTSIIRGFAVTLGIGVLVSMFSAVIVTRSFLRLINPKSMEKISWLLGAKHNIK